MVSSRREPKTEPVVWDRKIRPALPDLPEKGQRKESRPPPSPACPSLCQNLTRNQSLIDAGDRRPQGHSGKESACQGKRHRFDPLAGKIPWGRKWRPTPVFLPGKSCGQRSLAGCSPWGHQESDTTEQLNNNNECQLLHSRPG